MYRYIMIAILLFAFNSFAKTIYVKGYFRKDGTYVRSHYRHTKTNNYAKDNRPKLKILKEVNVYKNNNYWIIIYFRNNAGTVQRRCMTIEQYMSLFDKYNVSWECIKEGD